MSLSDLGLSTDDVASQLTIEDLSLPRTDRLTKILDGDSGERVQQLLSILRQEEKVL